MIQQSQGLVVDRTRETLTATDAAIVRFRRLLIESARDLFVSGLEPEAPYLHKAYRTRPGAWVTSSDKELDEVLVERFGNARGLVS